MDPGSILQDDTDVLLEHYRQRLVDVQTEIDQLRAERHQRMEDAARDYDLWRIQKHQLEETKTWYAEERAYDRTETKDLLRQKAVVRGETGIAATAHRLGKRRPGIHGTQCRGTTTSQRI